MVLLPTVDKFPTFAEAQETLSSTDRRCIWYLPHRSKSCAIRMNKIESKKLLELANGLLESKRSKPCLETLQEIAEGCCCPQWHRDALWGSQLVISLAGRWQDELVRRLDDLSLPVATEGDEVVVGTVVVSDGITVVKKEFGPSLVSLNIKQLPIPPQMWREISFSAHAVSEGSTLSSLISSAPKHSAAKVGSLYIFTYNNLAFEGMVKIGYTSKPVHTRLKAWEECKYGTPSQVISFDRVRHPERVEGLTHFELIAKWRNLRWCNVHCQSHIEWFSTEAVYASEVVRCWKTWVELAEPYNRQGCLDRFWVDMIKFLESFKIPITGRLMLDIWDIECGKVDVKAWLNDGIRYERRASTAKEEESIGK